MGEDQAQEFDLGSDKASLIPPGSELLRDGNMDVLVLDASRRSLQSVRFFAPLEGQPRRAPVSVWKQDLAGKCRPHMSPSGLSVKGEAGSRFLFRKAAATSQRACCA